MNRLRARLRRLKGRRDPAAARQRRVLRWYLGLHERWSIEGDLGRPPVYGAVRECFAEYHSSTERM